MTLAVRPVATARDRREFIRLPFRLHRDAKCFVPPLLFDVKNRLARDRNPFFRHSDAELFIAERDGRVVGRIAAIENRRHNDYHDERIGFFGWFDCIDDRDVARELLGAARRWVADRGLQTIRGPASFSLNDECGLLVDGFDDPPMILTPWNPPYYEALVEACDLAPVMDLHAFRLEVLRFGVERIERIVGKVCRRENVTVRRFDRSRFREEVERIKEVYNDAWADNWGFVPMTEAEIDHMAKELRPILEPSLACFVECEGETVGFSLVLPDVNVILARLGGRLFPTGILRLLFGLKRVDRIRLLAMGIRKGWHQRGLDAVLYHDNFVAARDLGKRITEIGWVLESNRVMINTIERIGGVRAKTWRLYEGAS